jgi:ABC-type branched-subunit amino acid transport system ATPase component
MQGVTVTFGAFAALSSVSVSAKVHDVLGVIGPNGAGKSTLLNVVRG